MGKPGAYLTIARQEHDVRPAAEAVRDYDDIVVVLPRERQCGQASRCMNCGVAFCQSGIAFNGARQATGCPLHNLIPEINDLVFRRLWDDAAGRLALTNPFPEFTGRVCPSPCETACNLGLHEEAVTIHDNERAVSDYAWERGVAPLAKPAADAPLVSVVGSGPAGLAAAWELARRGVRVRVYERDDRPGGLLMYGIPNMKLPKDVVERRIALMRESGVEFACNTDAVERAKAIAAESAAIVLACGARVPRRVDVPGADLDGIHFAVEYLSEATRSLLDGVEPAVTANGKDVVVIGGGDTGVDCVATALRQGARSVRQVIRAQRPAACAAGAETWPAPRGGNAQAYGQREAEAVFGEDPRLWSTDTVGFADDGSGNVRAVLTRPIEADVRAAAGANGAADGCAETGARAETGACAATDASGVADGRAAAGGDATGQFRHADAAEIPAQLVLIAKGFTGPERSVLGAFGIDDASHEEGVKLGEGSAPVYLAGDARLGSTLVATAMADALRVAANVASALRT